MKRIDLRDIGERRMPTAAENYYEDIGITYGTVQKSDGIALIGSNLKSKSKANAAMMFLISNLNCN